MSNQKVTIRDYESAFVNICAGIGCEPKNSIYIKCYNETNKDMTIKMLFRIESYLSETCNRHPVYSDFIKAAYQCGYMKNIEQSKHEPCSLGLCDGSGYLSVQKFVCGIWQDFICRCSCRVGNSRSAYLGSSSKYVLRSLGDMRKEKKVRLYEQT